MRLLVWVQTPGLVSSEGKVAMCRCPRESTVWWQRQKWAGYDCTRSARIERHHQCQREAMRGPTQDLRELSAADASISDFRPQACERILIYGWKPSQWYLIPSALRNKPTSTLFSKHESFSVIELGHTWLPTGQNILLHFCFPNLNPVFLVFA